MIQEVITDPILFFIVLAVFYAYTMNMQKTTLGIGSTLFGGTAGTGTGIQDAITPPIQSISNILIPIGLLAYLILAVQAYGWLWGTASIIAIPFLATPLAAKLLVPRPFSRHYIERIRSYLVKRHSAHVASHDRERADAVATVLQQFEGKYPTST